MTLPFSVDPLLLASGGYQISRSVRLRSAASAYLNRIFTSGSLETTGTFSSWVKRGKLGAAQNIFLVGNSTSAYAGLYFNADDTLGFSRFNVTNQAVLITTQVFRDPSAWYHIVVAWDSTQATASNRIKMYVNGVQITSFSSATYPTQNLDMYLLNGDGTTPHQIGSYPTNSNYFDGYLAEIYAVKGQQLAASSFGFTDTNGIWQPKAYTGTYGTNGFYLNFTDNSAATATTLGKDYSGNGNNWTPNNISVTAGVTYDSMIDSPTNSASASNYCTYTPLATVATGGGTALATLNGGNLNASSSAANFYDCYSTFNVPNSGKWYFEWNVTTVGTNHYLGIASRLSWLSASRSYQNNGNKIINGTGSAYGATYTSGDVIGCAIDMATGTLVMYKNNTSQGTLASDLLSSLPAEGWAIIAEMRGTAAHSVNFGQRPFTYTPPAGYSALNTYNLPAATINNGATVMAASTYTGTGATQSIVNSGNNAAAVSFKPDLVWIKGRNVVSNNVLIDSVRGASVLLSSDQTGAESSATAFFSSINSNGFTVTGTSAASNQSGESLIGWQWQAGQGTTTVNTSGTITSNVSVNQSAGFSVVTWTGNGTTGATLGHGLGVVPAMIFIKSRSLAGSDWEVFHKLLNGGTTPWNYALSLNLTAANAAYTGLNNTTPTSSVITLGSNGGVNQSAATYVAYCWSEVAGYSKFGSYTGNGSTDGPFVYLGFRPRWIMVKYYGGTVVADGPWVILDTSRDTYNVAGNQLYPNSSSAEGSAATADILSNGFKFRGLYQSYNSSGTNYIFAAFAENPFTIARAR